MGFPVGSGEAMNILCLLNLKHNYQPEPQVGSGFVRERCTRCNRVRARVAPPLRDQVEKRLDLVPNPKYWTPGPGVSEVDQVGVANPWLQKGYANEELSPPETTESRSN
jgi:hypothetical protein